MRLEHVVRRVFLGRSYEVMVATWPRYDGMCFKIKKKNRYASSLSFVSSFITVEPKIHELSHKRYISNTVYNTSGLHTLQRGGI